MDIEAFRQFCLELGEVGESLPFGPNVLVFKVKGKIFALCGLDDFRYINLKCDPERAVMLREEYPYHITPGYHMNKTHWNSVSVELDQKLIKELTLHSFELVRR